MSSKKDLFEQIRILKTENPGWGRIRIAKELGCSDSKVRTALEKLKDLQKPGDEISKDFKKDTGVVTTRSLNIKTLDDALRVSEVDLEVWEVDRYIINSWEVTMGTDVEVIGDPKNPTCWKRNPETYTNYQVKVWLKKKVIDPVGTAIESIVERMKKYSPKYKSIQRKKFNDPCLLELSLYDLHFGMLAWRHETRQDYDIKISESFYINAVEDLISRISGFNIEKILMPIGQDFFHINDPTMSTPKGNNRLDVDCRMAKVFEAGKMAVIKVVDMCRQIAPVDILWVPGNHDPMSSYYLCQALWGKHHNDPEVNVNIGPTVRKHYKYGINFIGLTHGDEEPWRDLPRIFMDEYCEDWASTKYREIHVGHQHKKKKTDFVSVDSFGGTSIRMIPSLCSTDAWHYLKGYVGKDRAAEALLWHKEGGLIGSFLTHVPDTKLGNS